ncbi:LmeA family phospholipid-binding protein [Streptomyces griseiscabiei]|uniref:DUF2993 domain-containing protein n=1 Tax=Streptomyces griseiscabiei TaxID=2993540 RepID=A0ABU4LL87_9ACTN|nr:DUF2993 domain-containing protein [Streptomyces griseiscabiei]MDX2915909.1 DUF2993 domain-containing protein [Streptomyces griseiscabiei]
MYRSRRDADLGYDYAYEPGDGPTYDPQDPPPPRDRRATWGSDSTPRPHRRRRRPLAIAAASLAALVLAPVAVDGAVAARIESRTAEAFQKGMGTPARPEVEVHGFPVIAQAATGTLDRVDITAHDIPADDSDRPLPVTELSLELDGLTKSDDDSQAHARTAEATAFLSYADLSDALGLEISRGYGTDRVRARVLTTLGFEVTATTTVSAASGNRVAFEDFRVAGRVALPEAGEKLLDRIFAEPVPLRNIPEGLHLRSVTPTDKGLTARFSGRSVTFHPDADTQSTQSTQDTPPHGTA